MAEKKRRLWLWLSLLLLASPLLPMAWTPGRLAFYELGLRHGPGGLQRWCCDRLASEGGFAIFARYHTDGAAPFPLSWSQDQLLGQDRDAIAALFDDSAPELRRFALQSFQAVSYSRGFSSGIPPSPSLLGDPAAVARGQARARQLARRDPEPELRLLALEVVACEGRSAASFIAEVLAESKEPAERDKALSLIRDLLQEDEPRALVGAAPGLPRALLGSVEEGQAPERAQARRLLEQLAEPVVASLMSDLASAEARVRLTAARRLAALMAEGWELKVSQASAFSPLLAFCREARGDPARRPALVALSFLVQVDGGEVAEALKREAEAGAAAALEGLASLAERDFNPAGERALEALKALAESDGPLAMRARAFLEARGE